MRGVHGGHFGIAKVFQWVICGRYGFVKGAEAAAVAPQRLAPDCKSELGLRFYRAWPKPMQEDQGPAV
jgi:hypothetical protein